MPFAIDNPEQQVSSSSIDAVQWWNPSFTAEPRLDRFLSSRTLTLVHEQSTNADDISEVMYCHRFCDAHEHKDEHPYESPTTVDLHSEAVVLETTDCLIIAPEHFSTDLIQCQHCSADLGSLGKESLLSIERDIHFVSRHFRSEKQTGLVEQMFVVALRERLSLVLLSSLRTRSIHRESGEIQRWRVSSLDLAESNHFREH